MSETFRKDQQLGGDALFAPVVAPGDMAADVQYGQNTDFEKRYRGQMAAYPAEVVVSGTDEAAPYEHAFATQLIPAVPATEAPTTDEAPTEYIPVVYADYTKNAPVRSSWLSLGATTVRKAFVRLFG